MSAGDSATESLEVCVLGTFRFWAEGTALPAVLGGSQRLLALLSLRDRASCVRAWPAPSGRSRPRSTPTRACGPRSVGSAGSRATRWLSRHSISAWPTTSPSTSASHACSRIGCSIPARRCPRRDLSAQAIAALSLDVLPDWYDDWVLVEAEEWRQLRLHALDALADRLLNERRFGEATGAALAAVRAEPLRESARALVIRVHLAEGNQSEALAEFNRYRALLRAELGLEPTPRLCGLVADLQRR